MQILDNLLGITVDSLSKTKLQDITQNWAKYVLWYNWCKRAWAKYDDLENALWLRNPNTNTPLITSWVGEAGQFYIVSEDALAPTGIDNIWQPIAGNQIYFDGSSRNTGWLPAAFVESVNGVSGVVILEASDIPSNGGTVQSDITNIEGEIATLSTESLNKTTDPYLEDIIVGDKITIDKTDPKNPIVSSVWRADEWFVFRAANTF